MECVDTNPFTPFSTVCLTPYRYSEISRLLDKIVQCCYSGFYYNPTNDLVSDTRSRKDGRTDVVFTYGFFLLRKYLATNINWAFSGTITDPITYGLSFSVRVFIYARFKLNVFLLILLIYIYYNLVFHYIQNCSFALLYLHFGAPCTFSIGYLKHFLAISLRYVCHKVSSLK